MPNAVKLVANYIRKNPETEESATLQELCKALEEQASFDLGRLFALKTKPFDLAMELMIEWRFDRHVVARRLQKYLNQPED